MSSFSKWYSDSAGLKSKAGQTFIHQTPEIMILYTKISTPRKIGYTLTVSTFDGKELWLKRWRPYYGDNHTVFKKMKTLCKWLYILLPTIPRQSTHWRFQIWKHIFAIKLFGRITLLKNIQASIKIYMYYNPILLVTLINKVIRLGDTICSKICVLSNQPSNITCDNLPSPWLSFINGILAH